MLELQVEQELHHNVTIKHEKKYCFDMSFIAELARFMPIHGD